VSRRRGATGLRGILVVDKPTGPTSHDVVARLRRASGESRIGHAGTLDPLASGVLIVLVGSFARLDRYLTGCEKEYVAEVSFGTETDTDDAEGSVTMSSPVPDRILDAEYATSVLEALRGPSLQKPPAYSAIKVQGRTAYSIARGGGEVILEPRPIVIHEAELLGIDPQMSSWQVRLLVSKGTYIRSVARDLGRSLGSAAHLSGLRRTASGVLGLDEAISLDQALQAGVDGTLPSLFASAPRALGFPVVELSPAEVAAVLVGRSLPGDLAGDVADADQRVSLTRDGELIAVYRGKDGLLVPETVMVSQS